MDGSIVYIQASTTYTQTFTHHAALPQIENAPDYSGYRAFY